MSDEMLRDGVLAHTPWGEIAHAIADKEGYARVRNSDEGRIAPGQFRRSFFPWYNTEHRHGGIAPERTGLVPSMRLLPLVGRVDPLLVGLSGT